MLYRKATDRDIVDSVKAALRVLRYHQNATAAKKGTVAVAAFRDLHEMFARGVPTSELWDLAPGQVDVWAEGPGRTWVPADVREKFVWFAGGKVAFSVPVLIVYDADKMAEAAGDIRAFLNRQGYIHAEAVCLAEFKRRCTAPTT